MPYIRKAQKDAVDRGKFPENAGELSYKITSVIVDYIKCHGTSYKVLNEVLGALEGSKLEFYRRVVADYEDTKKFENGDVFTKLY